MTDKMATSRSLKPVAKDVRHENSSPTARFGPPLEAAACLSQPTLHMSSTTHALERHTCGQCGEKCDPMTTVAGAFCSERCLYRHRGQKAIQRIVSDHRWCATCFRQIKTVHRPPESELVELDVPKHIRKAFVGFQYRTDHAVNGVDCKEDPDLMGRRIEYTRTSCECGAVDPSDRHEILRDLDTEETIQMLWKCLVRLEKHGTIQKRPNKQAYLDALRDSEFDWPYAIGRALYADG